VGQCLRSLPTGLGKRPVSVCAGSGRDVFPAPVGPSPTTAVRRCRSAGRSSAGRFCVLSLSRFTDSRSDRCPYCQSARLRRDSAVRQDGSVSCQSVSEVGSGQFVHLRPLRFGVATRQWHISLPASLRLGEALRFGRTVLAACLRPPRLPPRFGGSLTAPRTGRVRLGISGVGPTATGARHGELISPRVSESDLLATPLTGRCVSDSPHLSCPVSPRIGKSGWQVWQSGPTVAGGWEFAHGACSPSTATSPEFPGPTHSLRTPGSCQL